MKSRRHEGNGAHQETMKQYIKSRKSKTLFGIGFMQMILLPQFGFLRGDFLANHLVSTDNQNNQKTEHIPTINNT